MNEHAIAYSFSPARRGQIEAYLRLGGSATGRMEVGLFGSGYPSAHRSSVWRGMTTTESPALEPQTKCCGQETLLLLRVFLEIWRVDSIRHKCLLENVSRLPWLWKIEVLT